VWGKFRRARANTERDQLRRPLVQSRAKQNNLFLFRRIFLVRRIFWWRAQIGNRKEYFAWRHSGGGEQLDLLRTEIKRKVKSPNLLSDSLNEQRLVCLGAVFLN
jgi:hypothetical protein